MTGRGAAEGTRAAGQPGLRQTGVKRPGAALPDCELPHHLSVLPHFPSLDLMGL